MNQRLEWKWEVEEWNGFKGEGRGRKLLLGKKKAILRPMRPPANAAEGSEVSSAPCIIK